jgi:hypothetical protein
MSDLIVEIQCDEIVDYRPTAEDLAEYAAYLSELESYEVE